MFLSTYLVYLGCRITLITETLKQKRLKKDCCKRVMHNNALLHGHWLFFFLRKNNEFANSISRDEKSCNFKGLSLVLLLFFDLNHRKYCATFEIF